MKIKKIQLTNFKFHQKLEFEIKNKNCLIYGENGTGKSSIYEALNSIFTIHFRDKNFSINKFKHHTSNEELSAKVIFDNNDELIIPKEDIQLREGTKTIYFANQDLLESIILNENFYNTIENDFKNTFATLHNFHTNFRYINSRIDKTNYQQEDKKRKDNIKKMELFFNQIELRANDIINNHFQENFTIKFEYIWGLSNTEDDFKYPNPKITLKIDNNHNLKLSFNEAKLKLTSIAIFFALIKLEEGEDNSNHLKLLILDDFLTSLDMANRHYIIEYILTEFPDYQKIILTHNLQFYNLIIKLLKSKEDDTWDIKNIFLNKDKEALIYTKETDYIKTAKIYLDTNSLDEAGIYLRKEFERIVEELRIITEVGAKEKLSNIIKQLLDLSDTDDINIKKMQNILKKTKFYQQITLHSTAHDDIENEKYIKELDGAIVILTLLNKQIKILKKEN